MSKVRYDVSRNSFGLDKSMTEMKLMLRGLYERRVDDAEAVAKEMLAKYYNSEGYFYIGRKTVHVYISERGHLVGESSYYDPAKKGVFDKTGLTADEMDLVMEAMVAGRVYSNRRHLGNELRKYAMMAIYED